MTRKLFAFNLVLAVLVACGTSLLDDPSFDLWCGTELCAPWQAVGTIKRIKTWHRSDYGVALEDGSMLSQLSTEDPVSCIALDLIADVTVGAGVWLELDFNDDGSSEFKQLVPESRWAKLDFAIAAPARYESVRFILRKTGTGRAVLAQITAEGSGQCSALDPLPATHRDNGVRCTSGAQCEGGGCEARTDLEFATTPHLVCGECDAERTCPDGTRCGSLRGVTSLYPACVPLLQDVGAACDDASQCESEHCDRVSNLGYATCAQCLSDDECADGTVCGLGATELGSARMCVEPNTRALGAACVNDSECTTGSCIDNTCSQCSDDQPCPDGAACVHARSRDLARGLFVTTPGVCIRTAGMQGLDEPCNLDSDCGSNQCERPDPICFFCTGMSCSNNCVVSRQLAGRCR